MDPVVPAVDRDPAKPTDGTQDPPGKSPADTGDGIPGEQVECYEFRAHSGDKASPFEVPSAPDSYACFDFVAPWTGPVHGVSASSIIDNSASIHHWIWYVNSTVKTDGAVRRLDCNGSHTDGTFTFAWAPGAENRIMPPDVGIELSGASYTLELHYNSPGGTQLDQSGVKICVTHQLRANTAAMHVLGREAFVNATTVTGTCKPTNTGMVTVLTSNPHMHQHGTHLTTVIHRAGGADEVLIDTPFSFSSQTIHDTPTVIMPGDTFSTTCTFNAPSTFGPGTVNEMCYNFLLAYPAGQLAGGNGFLNNGNTCIEEFL